MPLKFYPSEELQKGSYEERIELLMEAAEQYKAVILDVSKKPEVTEESSKRRMVPRDEGVAYNWEEISRVLREVRELTEANKEEKLRKATLLTKLAEVYEVLRAAKMSKLEAVRLALIGEANQLKGSASQVA